MDPSLFLRMARVSVLCAATVAPSAAQVYQFTRIVDGSTVRPDGLGTFYLTNRTTPSYDGTWVVFRDAGPQNDDGSHAAIWSYDTRDASLHKIVDFSTAVPGTGATFNDLELADNAPIVAHGTVVFVARDTSGMQGLYSVPAGGGPVIRIADRTTPDPSGGTFSVFDGAGRQMGAFSFDGVNVAFHASGSTGTGGISQARPDGGGLALIADGAHPAPNAVANFATPAISGSNVLITGADAAANGTGFNGIYLGHAGSSGAISSLLNSSQPLPGDTTAAFHTRFDPPVLAIDGALAAFHATDSASATPSNPAGFFGLYALDLSSGSFQTIADVNSTLAGLGTLTSIGAQGASVSQGWVLFRAADATGNSGLYVWKNGTAVRAIGRGDPLGTLKAAGFNEPGPAALAGANLVFVATFGAPYPPALYLATTSTAGALAHLASGAGWSSTVTLVNTGAAPQPARVDFFDDNGNPLALPLQFPQSPGSAVGPATAVDRVLAPGATLVIESPDQSSTLVGSGQVLAPAGVAGFAKFRFNPTGQEAAVPLEERGASALVLPFDNTGGVSTGVAVANQTQQPAAIAVSFRDETGAATDTSVLNLTGQGHASFMLAERFPAAANRRGTVEFRAPAGIAIGVLGLRAAPMAGGGFAVTTLPALGTPESGGGAMAQVACGGGWQTTFTLVNTGVSAAPAELSFFDDQGTALTLPLQLAGSTAVNVSATFSQILAPGGSVTVTATEAGCGSAVVGSAELGTANGIGGFAMYRFNASGQEAAVPVETRSGSNLLAFDNTGGVSTGVALTSTAAQPSTVTVTIRDDTGASLGSATLALAARGHASFMLTDRYPVTAARRGTVQFDAPAGVRISALGLRAAPIPGAGSFAVTTIPVAVF